MGMNCPVCKTVNLVMSERQGIEIDYCPQCRGVWMDRGELDKIIDRSLGAAPQAPSRGVPPREEAHPPYRDDAHRGYYKRKKREGFLSDLFDFD
jgi:Zn-finger nucleic acid-binding protein